MVTSISPRGPKGNPILGVLWEFGRDPLGFLTHYTREYGDVLHLRFLYRPVIVLSHPDDIEAVLVTNSRNFIKSASFRTPFMQRLIGQGLVTSDGDFWRRQRRLSQPAFHRERIASYGRVMTDLTDGMLAQWHSGTTLDVHAEMMHVTLQVAAKTLFDADVTGAVNDVGSAMEVVIDEFGSQSSISWILKNHLPTPGNIRFNRAVQQLEQIIYKIVGERRRSGQDAGDLLSMLLHAQDEDGSRMTDQQLRDEVMTLFLAGHETTALALSWSFYLLSQHPGVEAKLFDEIASVLGDRAPTCEDLPNLRYAEKVVKESMRLYPPAWGMGREAVNDCQFGGYHVPAGRMVTFFQWVVHRDPRFWQQPEEFYPDRWTPEMEKHLPKYAYFPFGGGPRMCIGYSFAMMEAVLILTRVVQQFKLALAPGQQIVPFPSLTLRPKYGVKMNLTKR